MSSIMEALRQFEAVEANLVKLERLWDELQSLFPSGISLGPQPEYMDRSRSFDMVLSALPSIDGWRPEVSPPNAESVGASRLDYMELGELVAEAQFEASLWSGGNQIKEYRFRFDLKRRQLVRDTLVDIMEKFDEAIQKIAIEIGEPDRAHKINNPLWDVLINLLNQIEVLLGSSIEKPAAWSNLQRHLHFGQAGDFYDIEAYDWPNVKKSLERGLYGANEPIPVSTLDLANLVATKPSGPITVELQWSKLTDDGFERLLFSLISNQIGYENPEWLMRTRAPDRGRDLSATRVIHDALAGTRRERVIIQCKHWLTKSIALAEVAAAKEQTTIWNDPRVDVLVVATSGRFTADAVQWVERHNANGTLPRIEMWPESHLEHLLASRPALIAEFKLR